MLTLEEAVAKYKEAKDILIEYADTRRKHYPDGMGWATETLDAAVRDVALAAVRAMCDEERGLRSISPEAEINRLFPHG